MKQFDFKIIIVILFCAVLFGTLFAFIILPKSDYSPAEKRYLTGAPNLSFENILSGKFSEEAESFIADHIPGRKLLIGLSANYDRLSLRQTTKDIYMGTSGRLYEKPNVLNESIIRRNMACINEFADNIGTQVEMMIVPSAGFIMQNDIKGLYDTYNDDKIISAIYSQAGAHINTIDLLDSFSSAANGDELYYKTDHHWTSRGAYSAYCVYMQAKGRLALPEDAYDINTAGGFHGSTYSRSTLWQVPSESIEMWTSNTTISVEDTESDAVHKGVFFPENLDEDDKYTVFLDGNHSVITTHNPDGTGKLLVIRDSYANCLGCFLADSYETVTMVDLRYYKEPVSDLYREGNYDDVLILYSIGNFLSDANIIWLE